MNKNELKSQYDEYTSEYLLQLRARGDGLSDIAHEVIEEIMESRGEPFPPRPKSPVSQLKTENKNQDILKLIGGALALFCAIVVAQMLKMNILLAFIVSFIFIAFLLYGWNKKRKSSPEDIARAEALAKIGNGGFTELMFYASEGNLERVQDIVNYTSEINIQDHQGGTALMYASKNGRESVVEFLLKSKANPALKTKAGSTALDFAKREGHEEIVKLLS
jgi:ankyrin repeat protein